MSMKLEKQSFVFTVNKVESEFDIFNRVEVSSNYYELSIDDREELVNLILDWILKEKKTVYSIKNRNQITQFNKNNGI